MFRSLGRRKWRRGSWPTWQLRIVGDERIRQEQSEREAGAGRELPPARFGVMSAGAVVAACHEEGFRSEALGLLK